MDDPCIKIQLQTEYIIYIHIFFIKSISSCARIEFLWVLQNILREFELVILVGKEFQRGGPVNFRERKPYSVVLTEITLRFLLHDCLIE